MALKSSIQHKKNLKRNSGFPDDLQFNQKPVKRFLGETAKPLTTVIQNVSTSGCAVTQLVLPELLCSMRRMSSTDTELSGLTLNFGWAFNACP